MDSIDLTKYWFESADSDYETMKARYDDYKKSFDEKCTDDYTSEQVNNIEEVKKWLKEQ